MKVIKRLQDDNNVLGFTFYSLIFEFHLDRWRIGRDLQGWEFYFCSFLYPGWIAIDARLTIIERLESELDSGGILS